MAVGPANGAASVPSPDGRASRWPSREWSHRLQAVVMSVVVNDLSVSILEEI